ncbi:SDR family NAD(P)-dependent oxidoreductase [Virgibacillus halotolerans]|uniref:SDR family NAD(P)-dependent oxidoreductase n=1 Tax=Virgibacillus halotolerans TaxID=1071053 RepID=UPI0019611D04|nr:SDR family oxidoreductase [Virgibacillus halotolerans]
MELLSNTAIITGAGQGIGKAIALKLASEGADIAVVDINDHNVQQTVEEIKRLGRQGIGYTRDLTIIKDIELLYNDVSDDFGKIDIVVNGAGVVRPKPILENIEDDWNFIMDINAKATFFSIQHAVKHMKKTGGGNIVNIASIAGRQPSKPDMAIYGASKAAVINITKSAATAFGPDNINVNAICPGVVHTKMWDQIDSERADIYGLKKGDAIHSITTTNPKGRAGKLSEIAGLVFYLVSEEGNYVNGQSINICGGLQMD